MVYSSYTGLSRDFGMLGLLIFACSFCTNDAVVQGTSFCCNKSVVFFMGTVGNPVLGELDQIWPSRAKCNTQGEDGRQQSTRNTPGNCAFIHSLNK